MPYPEYLIAPMRQELTAIGARECRTAAEVDTTLKTPGVVMMVVLFHPCRQSLQRLWVMPPSKNNRPGPGETVPNLRQDA